MYTFEQIVGNEQIKKNLQNSILNNKLSHAYIINGADGCGKKLLANTLAKTLQCEKNVNDACCECTSCKVFDSSNHPDVIYVKTQNKKSIGIEDIRQQVINIVQIKPYKYKYKIFIIENADTMTTQAQNSILKTIEEPPSYAVFLLLSNKISSFLPTIISRCVILKIKPLSEDIISKYITYNLNINSNLAKIYSTFAQGSIGKAILISNSEEFINIRNKTINWFISLKEKDIIQIFELASEVETYKSDITNVLDIAYIFYRDILIAKNVDTQKYILQTDKLNIIKQQCDILSYESIFKILDIIESTKQKLKFNVNIQLALEIMLLKIKELYND